MTDKVETTRLAPSPTGALHLGNARTFLINWALARQNGWRVILRIEDLDTPRTKRGADLQAIDDLAWLGMDWDEGPTYQLADLSPYEEALARLGERGLIYPCRCTRKEIEQALSAPHGDDHELRYPGTCRPGDGERTGESTDSGTSRPSARDVVPGGEKEADAPAAWRLVVPDEAVEFADACRGVESFNVQGIVGDFVVATKAGLPAYQLAVVVDDARQQVTQVVRGDDLLNSTARQIWLYRVLDLGPQPNWWHLPLVVGEDGRRLAKRHGDTRLATYRTQGVAAERIIGLIAWWSGVVDERRPLSAKAFCEAFDMEKLPRAAVTFTQEDHAWLCR